MFASTKEIIKSAKDKMEKSIVATKREFSTIRTGRASAALVEGINVNYYGTSTPLKQLANISVPDIKHIVIQPWDPSCIKDIDKAIQESPLDIMPNNDGKMIRINIPPLSEERRNELIKVTKKMAEDGKVSIRTLRRDAIEHIKALEKDGKATEDEKFTSQKDIQNITDEYTKKIDEILKHKEEEMLEV